MPAPVCKKIWIISETTNETLDTTTTEIVYGVQFDTSNATTWEARVATDGTLTIPGATTTWHGFPLSNRVAKRRSFDEDGAVFDVTCTFTSVKLQEPKPDEDNVKWQLEFSSDGIVYTEEINKDLSDTPKEIRNAAGEPIEPRLTREYFDEEFAIGFKADRIDFTNIAACRGCVNSESLTMTIKGVSRTFAAKTLRLVRAPYAIDPVDKWWKVQYVLQYRADTWITKIQSQGFNIKDGDGKLKRIKIDGKDCVTQQFHNADGTDYIKPGDTLPDPLEFWNVKAVAFTSLFTGITTIP